MSTERWHRKADAYAWAWWKRFGALPSKHCVILGLAVAEGETRCGDSWPGPDGIIGTQDDEHNWGATTLRRLNAAELAVLANAGLAPTVGGDHKQRAERAMALIRDAGLPLPQGVLHCDSYTDARGLHPYFVYFATFPDDVGGAHYFLKLLADGKPARAVLERETGSEYELAAAMRAAGYYTGFHDNATKEGYEANVKAYAALLQRLTPSIRVALADWTPSAPPPELVIEPVELEVDWEELEADRDAMIRDKDFG